ncbi:IS110 family transposase [Sebaldella sp. S0638]|uniref:IS110 family transposase n=1 Tax=Sebaldella sp. S0638 TaxID=2957809 RepID=UPI00209E9726|nr:IS110 family transposase [Sebaldella sp. S0638]MCP1225954.1 IS110 family transposase [Sebaldella sp. S0638]
MIYIGIDVAKDKHDCFITNSDGEIFCRVFSIHNNRQGFDSLYQKIESICEDLSKVRVGLEATGHYSYNLLGYLLDKGLTTFVINPLHTSLYRKSLSLRKMKTDKVDAHTIATMLMSDVNLKSYSDTSHHNEELKSLTRYRFDKVKQRAKLKGSISRLVTILFPELEKLVSSLHLGTIYDLFYEFPSAQAIAHAHLTKLTNLLSKSSKGKFNKDTAFILKEAAKTSIGSNMPAKSLELRHTIKLIHELTSEIEEIELAIKSIMDEINSPILSIPGISYRMGAMILAEIGDFTRFNSPDKILAYSGLSPSTYQSGQLESSYSRMEKRGSRYLRYALFNATKFVCYWDPVFAAYLAKKRSEGKHYNVAVSHAAKKLIRIIFHLEKTGQLYNKVT